MKSILLVLISGIAVLGFNRYSNTAATRNDADRRITMTPNSINAVSAFINDADDPVSLLGIDFTIGDDILPNADLLITASSSNTSVVPNENIFLSGRGVIRNLKIRPIAAGYSTITVTVSNGSQHRNYILNYAASKTTTTMGKRWHTGIADASAGIVIDNDYMIVANDETNYLYLYNRNHSGQPVKTFDFNQGNILRLTDSTAGNWKEVDIEGAVRSISNPSVIYWIGSMSNNSSFLDKPNRNRLFAINISGKGAATHFTNSGYYNQLRQKLISWGNEHGYDFATSAAVGKNPKLIDGFNIEGMVFGPDNRTIYVGFRAPLVPINSRTKAVIAPIKNFERWFNKGRPTGNPEIGSPIELDLGGRGIRDIIRLPNSNYVIIAGSSSGELIPAVYTWTGDATDAPVNINSITLTGLNVEGAVPVYEGGRLSLNKLQLLTDNGNEIFYGDTVIAKNLFVDNFKKFSSIITELPNQGVPFMKQKP